MTYNDEAFVFGHCVGLVGCMTMPDGSLGVKPEVADVADTVASIGSTVAVVGAPLTVLWPPLALIAAIIGGVSAAWKGRKANTSHGVTEALVTGIEKFKTTNPDSWSALEIQLSKTIGPTAEGIIRAIRGLPPKV
jgi:hypothetical protein